MYSYEAKQNAILKNSTPKYSQRTEYFNKTTQKLIKDKGLSRKNARAIIRQALDKIGDIGASEFASKNLRQTRRSRSKRLKVPFQPLYNGPRFKVQWSKDGEGNWQQEFKAL
jgi:hypothetical protein